MIQIADLETMAEQLRVYDVVQEAWEGDPETPTGQTVEANLAHVAYHLGDLIYRKDFYDQPVVTEEIAPDLIQYALRFSRWGDLDLERIIPGPNTHIAVRETHAKLHILEEEYPGLALSGVIAANGILNKQLHDEDHVSSREEAAKRQGTTLSLAGSLLVHSAWLQSAMGQFDLAEAFTQRLDGLRVRFGIPLITEE